MGVEKNLGKANLDAFNSCWNIFEMDMNDSIKKAGIPLGFRSEISWIGLSINVLSDVIFSVLASGYNNGSHIRAFADHDA